MLWKDPDDGRAWLWVAADEIEGGQVTWPVRAGVVPSLACGSGARAKSAADLQTALAAGGVVWLVPARTAADGKADWLEPCGKTQLAVSVAESMWRSGQLELLVWVAAASRASVLAGYVEAAVATLGGAHESDGESVAAHLAGWLAETSRPWLLILDDLRDMADLDGLWPAGPAGRVLVTTANPSVRPDDEGALVQPVGAFSPDEARNYLLDRLADDARKRTGATELAAGLGGEPLALAHAGAVIASSALSCREYLNRFARSRQQLAEAAGAAPAAAAVTWRISAEYAAILSPGGSAQALLALAAILDGHGIPRTVFATPAANEYLAAESGAKLAGREPCSDTLLAAERTGLMAVEPDADQPGGRQLARMNSAVQTAILASMPDGMLDRAGAAAANALLQAWPADEQPIWLAAALRSCALTLRDAAGDLLWAVGCHPLLMRAGRSLDQTRLSGPAVTYWRQLAAVSDRILGRGHPDTLAIGERLAEAHLAAGQVAEAVTWFRWVLAERVRVLGPDHPSAIAGRRELGRALVATNQFSEAVTVIERTLGDYERVWGMDQPETLGARDELAAAYQAAGQFADAIVLFCATLASRERIQGAEHPDTMATRHKLAAAYLADGEVKTAISHCRRVLTDRRRVLGHDHLDTIAACGSLGSAYYTAGRMASALQLYEQARAGYDRVLGANHPGTLASNVALARAYYDVGRVTDARTLLADTLARCEQALPPDAPLTQAVRRGLADLTGG